ncbi:hypothetical protein LTR37_017371 [Vermiconidia calcicola]|uniref:Uncharacterized protein n=1 Tax=Vermiconidia calcicola TaxID=1690605 RepID=A0ACC3MKI4_9PEZI|nr:hypothetical protein LTR37_017371 [Vermiconidia calcicola]
MNFINEIVSQGRRIIVDTFSGGGIERDAPFSPEIPEDLRQWLPDLFDRFPIVFPWQKPVPVDPALHNVWIFDNTAFRTPRQGDERPDLEEVKDPKVSKPTLLDGPETAVGPAMRPSGWEVEFVACYFIKNSGKDESKVVAGIAHALNIRDDDLATHKRIAKRVQPFIDTVLPSRTLRITMDGKEEQTLGPSSYSGISTGNHELHFDPPVPGEFKSTPVNLPPPFSIPSRTILAEETGWGIISDIDDTIKITMTPDPLGILNSTFIVEEPDPVPGMPELYARITATLNSPPFFYLSASPYNLYPFLKQFREKYFPPGTIILRDASWQNLGGLITSLTNNTEEYKTSRLRKIHSWLPRRKFICIGDSTQSDPEAYGNAARKFPGWIRAIYIRKVEGIAAMDEKTKNSQERFEKAFEGVDRNIWFVFSEPRELDRRVEELAREGDAVVGGRVTYLGRMSK